MGALVYQNGPEWAELPEWTTEMDFNMQPLVLLLYFICLELPIVFTERSFNEKKRCSLGTTKNLFATLVVGVEGVCRGGGVVAGAGLSWINRHYHLGIYVDGVSAKLNIGKKLNTGMAL